MAVVPLVLGQSFVTSEEDFERRGARRGSSLLIRNFDSDQLRQGEPNLSYDLRVGSVYKDHADGVRRGLSRDTPEVREEISKPAAGEGHDGIKLFPGGAVLIETEESLHMPAGLFGYIVPRVWWLQKGVSNTLSKVDSGYNGRLVVTVFNLGQKTVFLPRKATFCALVVHEVGKGVCLYEGDAKTIGDEVREPVWKRILNRSKLTWQSFRGRVAANRPVLDLVLIVLFLAELFGVRVSLGKLLHVLHITH